MSQEIAHFETMHRPLVLLAVTITVLVDWVLPLWADSMVCALHDNVDIVPSSDIVVLSWCFNTTVKEG